MMYEGAAEAATIVLIILALSFVWLRMKFQIPVSVRWKLHRRTSDVEALESLTMASEVHGHRHRKSRLYRKLRSEGSDHV